MSYQALYRKFRPQTFDEVKGQDHIVQTLKNQINADRIGHAYLFCVTRGTGKTSIAKLFAKSLNCEHPVDGSPCMECDTCKQIADGSSMNVVEIDAASNNGVDDVRIIREEVKYSPTSGKKKVFIIDEVHMLSKAAFNALLKTLEEPPEYVTFILATTEPDAIPITILSRCQRYDFKRITVDIIAGRLREIMNRENVSIEDRAVQYIAKVADGSMRDALSLTDQCIAFYLGKDITYENVLDVLGTVDVELFSRLMRCVIAGDVSGCLRIVDEVIVQGREPDRFVLDFISYLRNLMLIKTAENPEDVIDASAERIAAYKEEADAVDIEVVMRYINVFSELAAQIKYSPAKRVLIEIALIKLNRPAMESDINSLINRMDILEKQLESGVVPNAGMFVQGMIANNGMPAQGMNQGNGMPAQSRGHSAETQQKPLEKAVPEDVKYVVENWIGVLDNLKSPMLKVPLKSAKLSAEGDNVLMILFDKSESAKYEFCSPPEKVKEIEEVIAEQLEKKVVVKIRQLEDGERVEDLFQLLGKKINKEIVEEDF